MLKISRALCLYKIAGLASVAWIGLCAGGAQASGKPAAGLLETLQVETQLGQVLGLQMEHGESFYGLPYAQAPVGERRWQAPLAYGAWSKDGPWDGRYPRSRCPQQLNPLLPISSEWAMMGDEDCLHLNIHRPTAATRAKLGGKLPVMVWFHGGSYIQGSGDTYDGEQLAEEQGVIIVTINYRLGALGFLAHPDLHGEGGAAPGNYALQDQILALTWLKQNIAAFDGDRDRVTIFGESAGAHSVCTLVATPAASGLFHGAIIQSSNCGSSPLQGRLQAEAAGKRFAASLGCTENVAACLRHLPAAQVAAAGITGKFAWNFSVGNALIDHSPSQLFKSGKINRVPVMIGTTHDEDRLFQLLRSYAGGSLSEEQYSAEVRRRFGNKAAAVLAAYNSSSYPTYGLALSAVLTDSGRACPLYRFSAVLAAATPTYMYEFNDPQAVSNLVVTGDVPNLGAYHSGELTYLFHKLWFLGNPYAFSVQQQALANQMATYWANFAKFGNPNGADSLVHWPATTPDQRAIMNLAPASLSVNSAPPFIVDHHCDLFN